MLLVSCEVGSSGALAVTAVHFGHPDFLPRHRSRRGMDRAIVHAAPYPARESIVALAALRGPTAMPAPTVVTCEAQLVSVRQAADIIGRERIIGPEPAAVIGNRERN